MGIRCRTVVLEGRSKPPDIPTGAVVSNIFTTYWLYKEPGGWFIFGGLAVEAVPKSRSRPTYR